MSDEKSNIVPFRPFRKGKSHSFEIVEILRYTMTEPPELWVAVAGPWGGKGREPWQLVSKFPHTEIEATIAKAQLLASELDVRIVDLAGVMPSEPEAA
ncbi:hypothetical protein [Sphingorhabdus contaminans]|uniref:Uncharacterized protein n=1 Tax=Sphingorhabdus contaminans TaxID=1343899 RepID=A0A553WH06_9SPHN|nr:hypothetical protein [Sphingorhabdus contaminans]TSB03973.1 hypothetical protein FOM92_00560 [Sphingorhabdus contaminans]